MSIVALELILFVVRDALTHVLFSFLFFFSTVPSSGVLIPIPQYPIYSATLDLLGAHKVGYYLDESKGWDFNIPQVEKALREAREQGIQVVAMVVINPGNPTGQVLSRKTIQEICKFCAKHKLVSSERLRCGVFFR